MTCPGPSRTSAWRRPGCAPGCRRPTRARAWLISATPTSAGATGTRPSPTPSWRPSLAQDTDRPLDLARAHARAAQVLACRGQWPAAQAHVGAARAAAERLPLVLAVAAAATAGAALASARGDLAGVLLATEPVRATGLLDAGGRPGIFNWRAIEADALIGLGRLDDAEAALGEFEAAIPAGRAGVGRPGAGPLPGQPGRGAAGGAPRRKRRSPGPT